MLDVAVSRDGAVRRPEMQADPSATAVAQTASSFGGDTLGTIGSMVTLKAPTGQTMQLAANDPRIPHFEAQGAQRI